MHNRSSHLEGIISTIFGTVMGTLSAIGLHLLEAILVAVISSVAAYFTTRWLKHFFPAPNGEN